MCVCQDYMARIVQRLPTVLRSRNMDEFLGISDRITTIRSLLGPNAGLLTSHSGAAPSSSSSAAGAARGGADDALGSAVGGNYEAVMKADEGLILTADKAELTRSRRAAGGEPLPPLDDDSLGRLEEDIKDLGYVRACLSQCVCLRYDPPVNPTSTSVSPWRRIMLRIASPLDVTKPGRLRDLLRTCTERWPRLRATAETAADAGGLDFRLIPRAMQAEEDLVRAIDDYQSLVCAGSLM